MTVSSMTGFARADGAHGPWRWHWELKSVNGRGLDMRLRLPQGFERLEQVAREKIRGAMARGSVQIGLQVQREAGTGRLTLNEDALAGVLEAMAQLNEWIEVETPSADGILSMRGVLESGEEDETDDALAERDAAFLASFDIALADLVKARQHEGAALETVVSGHVARIAELTEQAASAPGSTAEAIRDRLTARLEELLSATPPLPEERLAQEVALMATKQDVREELDRLRAHVESAHKLLKNSEPKGRKLDFLTQEFNREANTLCSKAADIELTNIGLELKSVVDQLREQVQNIE